jgi:hypothetical protein
MNSAGLDTRMKCGDQVARVAEATVEFKLMRQQGPAEWSEDTAQVNKSDSDSRD